MSLILELELELEPEPELCGDPPTLAELFCIYRGETYTENRPNSRFSRSFFDDTRPLLYDRFDRSDVATPVPTTNHPPNLSTSGPSPQRPATNKQKRSPRVQITIAPHDIHTLTHGREKHPFELSTLREILRGEKTDRVWPGFDQPGRGQIRSFGPL